MGPLWFSTKLQHGYLVVFVCSTCMTTTWVSPDYNMVSVVRLCNTWYHHESWSIPDPCYSHPTVRHCNFKKTMSTTFYSKLTSLLYLSKPVRVIYWFVIQNQGCFFSMIIFKSSINYTSVDFNIIFLFNRKPLFLCRTYTIPPKSQQNPNLWPPYSLNH